jgi:hypothetical protein
MVAELGLQLRGTDSKIQLEAMDKVQKIISVSTIKSLLNEGVVPLLVEFLSIDDGPLASAALVALSSMCAGSIAWSEPVLEVLLEHDGCTTLAKLLQGAAIDEDGARLQVLVLQCISSIISNSVGDNVEVRNNNAEDWCSGVVVQAGPELTVRRAAPGAKRTSTRRNKKKGVSRAVAVPRQLEPARSYSQVRCHPIRTKGMKMLVEAGLLSLLIGFMIHEDVAMQELKPVACRTLSTFLIAQHENVVHLEVVCELLTPKAQGNVEVLKAVLDRLQRLLSADSVPQFVEAGGQASLEQLQQHADYTIRANAGALMAQFGTALGDASAARVPGIAQQMQSLENGQPLKAARDLRSLLSVATSPPVAKAVEAGAAAVLAGMLADGDSEAPELQREAVEVLKLIATMGTAEHAQALIDGKACAALVGVLAADGDAAVQEAAICSLKHVAARVAGGGDGEGAKAVGLLLEDGKLVGRLRGMLSHESVGVREECCRLIAALADSGSTEQSDGLAEAGRLEAVCELLTVSETTNEARVVLGVLAATRALLTKGSKDGVAAASFEAAGGLCKLEQLRAQEDESVRSNASAVLSVVGARVAAAAAARAPRLVRQMAQADEADDRMQAAMQLRGMLSVATSPPVAEAVAAGAAAVLASLLADGEAPELQREALEVLKLIATLGDLKAKEDVFSGVCARLVRLLCVEEMRSAAAGALGVLVRGGKWSQVTIARLAEDGCVGALCGALALAADDGEEGTTASSATEDTCEPSVLLTAAVDFMLVEVAALSALTKMLEGDGDGAKGGMGEVAALMEKAGVLGKLEQLKQLHAEDGTRSKAAAMLEQHGKAIASAAATRVPRLVQKMNSAEELVKATRELRQVLSVKTSPPIIEAVGAGAIPLLLGVLARQDCWPVVVDAVNVVSSICAGGNTTHIRDIGPSAIPLLVSFLIHNEDAPSELSSEAMAALASICGNAEQMEAVVENDACEKLIGLLKGAVTGNSAAVVVESLLYCLGRIVHHSIGDQVEAHDNDMEWCSGIVEEVEPELTIKVNRQVLFGTHLARSYVEVHSHPSRAEGATRLIEGGV